MKFKEITNSIFFFIMVNNIYLNNVEHVITGDQNKLETNHIMQLLIAFSYTWYSVIYKNIV